MASNAVKTPLVRQITRRGYAQACANPALAANIKVTTAKTPNGIRVAAVENGSPSTRIAVSFKAGSRYEPTSDPGLSHALRSAAGLTTKSAQQFIIRRTLNQIGATLSATSDRELITYTLEVAKCNVRDAMKLLQSIISEQEFRPWELNENANRLRHDLVALPPQVRAVDLLHKAAYRRTLGNSLFMSPNRIGKISSESLQHFANNYLTPARCSVAVVGENAERGNAIANSLVLGNGQANDNQSKYSGGELRKEMGGELAHVAVAVEGAKAGTPEALALAVAAKALGNGPSTKWGEDNSVLAKSIGKVGHYAAAGFNVSYSDSGLYGLVLSVPIDEANAAVKGAVKALKSPLDPEAIKRGKNQLRVELLNEQDSYTSLAETISAQALTGEVRSPLELAEEVNRLSESQIASAVSNAVKGKLSMGAAGNLFNVPYLDEL